MPTNAISSRHLRATRYDRHSLQVLDWHEHRDLSFCFVMKGDYEETTFQRTVACRPGDVVVKGEGVRHLNQFGKSGAVCLLLEVSRDFLPGLSVVDPALSGSVRNHYLARIGLELQEELAASDELSPFMLEGIALRALASVLRLVKRKSQEQQQVVAARELLDRGARVESATRRYLTTADTKTLRRAFQETEGCSMYTYALRRRALRAYEELLSTDYSLAEIAARCGFYDQAHFTKVFSRLFSVTPGRFRSQNTASHRTSCD